MSRAPVLPSQDTIVAIATPPGASALGVIRLSGPRAMAAASGVTRLAGGGDLEGAPARMVHRAAVVDPATGTVVDEVLVARMPAPRSYTGEDVVELSCHGNPLLLGRIVGLLIGRGARMAAPGEFTRRAYVNGRMDLVQAEAVAALIEARSERALELAARELRGRLSQELGELRERVLDLVAGLEVALDFPEEHEGVARTAAQAEMAGLGARVDRLIEGARRGQVLRDGIVVMLAGPPNVGKSSLLNALLGRDRAIVAPEAGTTRDVVEGTLALVGVAVRLVDGAGLGEARDAVDGEAMRRTREAMKESDLLLVVVDGSRPSPASEGKVLALTAGRPRLIVANKCDLPAAEGGPRADVSCSALTGAGVEGLRRRIEAWIGAAVGVDGEEGVMAASLRVSEGLRAARRSLARALGALQERVGVEAALVDLRETLGEIEGLLGVRVEDAVLDRIFARFCVGK